MLKSINRRNSLNATGLRNLVCSITNRIRNGLRFFDEKVPERIGRTKALLAAAQAPE